MVLSKEIPAERFPTTIIDPSDKDLFQLMKEEADNYFNGEVNEYLVYMLIKKGKMLRFSHDFEANKLYIDFPDIK